MLVCAARVYADTTALLHGLDTDEPAALSTAIAKIEAAPVEPGFADVLFAAGRACEDRLHDPARALAIYERLLREMPDAGVAIAAERRAELLRPAAGHPKEAAALAQLIADADRLPVAEVEQRANALANAAWPGALDAALWLADWTCRTKRYVDADARYAALIARAAEAPQAAVARRNAAGCAVDGGRWARAIELARTLPAVDPVDAAVKSDLVAAARRGMRRAQLYDTAWIAFALAVLAMIASLVEAMMRGGVRTPSWKPPIEVAYIAPLAAIMVFAAYAIDGVIAPAVLRISLTGIGLAWLSGIALDVMRARGRTVRTRAVLHVVACAAAAVAIGYISIVHDGLIDMFVETVRFGPGA